MSLALLLWLAENSAAAGEPPTHWHLGAEATSDVPLSMGARLGLESPSRIRLNAGLGVFPLPYAQVFNQVLKSFDVYDPRFGSVLVHTLTNSMVGRFQLGWRPWRDWGAYLDVGYAFVALGSTQTAGELIKTLSDVPAEVLGDVARRRYLVDITLHMVVAELGYEWHAFDGLSLRWALGFAGTVAAPSSIAPDSPTHSSTDPANRFAEEASDNLHGMMTRYGFMPTVTFGLGYRFEGPETVDTD